MLQIFNNSTRLPVEQPSKLQSRLLFTVKERSFFAVILLLYIPVSVLFSQGPSVSERTPRVALVLSGGGAKGFAHIGVLKVLEEEGIPVDMIVGTSIGGIVGGFYSIGYTASELEEIVKSMNWENVLSDDVQRSFLSKHDQLLQQRYFLSLKINDKKKLSLPQGLLRGYNVLNTFCGLAGNVPVNADFSSFPVPFACIAVDLQTGREVILDKGFLPTALYSSMAIPVVFQPSSRDGVMLLDGGIKNNFPSDVAKKMGADIIIGVDIRLDYFDRKETPTINNVLGRIASFSNLEMDSVKRSYCNLIIRPDMRGYTMSSFSRTAADSLIHRGREAAERAREQLRTLKSAYGLEYHRISRQYINPDKWHITALQFTGDSYLADHYMEHVLNMDIPGEYTRDEIKSAIDRLYGLGGFEYIYYNLLGNSEGKVLNLNIMTNKSTNLNLGFRTNTTDNSAILLNLTSKNFSNIFGLFSADLELSANPELSFTTELNQRNLPAMGITISGKRQKYGIYNYGNKLSETSMFYARAGFYTYQPFLKNFSLGGGVMEEYYRMNNLSFGENMPFSNGKDDFVITNLYSFISYDNMDEYYFPHKGTEFYSELSLLTDLKRNSEVYLNFLLRNRNVFTLTSKMTLLLDLYSRIEFNPGVPLPKNTMIGGESYSQYFNYHFPFMGLTVVNVAGQYSYLGLAGLRFELPRSQYLSLIFNGLLHGSEFIPWNNDFIPGCGVRYSLKSILGPLDTSVGYSFSSDKPVFSAGFGFWF